MTTVFSHRNAQLLLAASALALPSALQAAIPPAVDAMIREAAKGGNKATLDAVVSVAKATNPEDAGAIDALGAQLLAEAQAKAEQQRREALATRGALEGWKGEGQAGLGFTSGNTRETSAVLGVKLSKDGLRTRHKITGLVDYLRTNGITTRQKYAVDYALDYLLGEHLYVVGKIGWEQDRFAGYARRFTESLGLGYRAIDAEEMTLDLEAGPALRQTRYVGGTGEDEFATRGSLAWRWKINEGMALTEDASVLYALSNTTLISTTALTAKLNGKLSTRLSFNVQKETDPPAGRESTDTATRFTIVYDF